ncbi:MurR/RpiR family transcriptional regulator [Heyndrickxia sporothermodurans]|uniref:MurR/RpiR family transcriptional regulator n=1 Tax=Heyndrickxia sporothermodurans TaxID=46224 RepID=UPI002DBAE218|nr:MurR/RpiR family transcriptional regulator [Heyndrickxia sporothermodurans]MEB6551454.1 MurR/RpiR family transcriptional regulator [Heyndrickxia sporothermodurans]
MLSILSTIQEKLEEFSRAERKVAQYVLDNFEFIINSTITDIANNAQVSEASVLRFCKTIGIGSFKAFKLALVRELDENTLNINDFSLLQAKDSAYEIFNKVTYINKYTLEMTKTSLDKKELEKAIGLISNAKRIAFFGVGGSGPTALDANYKFVKLGFSTLNSLDFHAMLSLIANLEKGDILIALSTSGKTKDVLEVVRFAKKFDAQIIAITSLEKSPLYNEADVKLCFPNFEKDHRVGSIASRIAQLNIIDTLYLKTFHIVGTKVIDKYQNAREEVLKLRR